MDSKFHAVAKFVIFKPTEMVHTKSADLDPRLWMCGAIPPPLHACSWCGVQL